MQNFRKDISHVLQSCCKISPRVISTSQWLHIPTVYRLYNWLDLQTDLRVLRCRAWNTIESYSATNCRQHLVVQHAGGFNNNFLRYRRGDTKYLVNAASEQPLESEPLSYQPKSLQGSLQDALNAFYKFSRPHTVIGTVRFYLWYITYTLRL